MAEQDKDLARITARRALTSSGLTSEQEARSEIINALNRAGVPVVSVQVLFLQNGSRQAEFCVVANGRDHTDKILCTKSMIQ